MTETRVTKTLPFPIPHSPLSPEGTPSSPFPIPTIIVWAIAAVVTAVFLWILSDIIWHGAGRLSWEFLTAAPENAGRRGGIAPILVSTLLILGVCMAVSVPIGIGTAVLLAEFTSSESFFGRLVRRSLDSSANLY